MADLASPLAEPRHNGRLWRWERRALATLLEDGEVAWSALRPGAAGYAAGARGPAPKVVRRFMGWLERGGAVAWDPYRQVFWLRDREAVSRLIRSDAQLALTAAYRAGHVADAEEP